MSNPRAISETEWTDEFYQQGAKVYQDVKGEPLLICCCDSYEWANCVVDALTLRLELMKPENRRALGD